MPPTTDSPAPGADLEARIGDVGRRLAGSLHAVVDSVAADGSGPAALARTLDIDKVLASRALKALRQRDPLAVVHLAPGPEPLRRFVGACARRGAPRPRVDEAEAAIDAFDELIRGEAGDRAGLGAILSAWLPEARAEFELRRKQAAFRAMSELRGAVARTSVATVFLHPAADGRHLDVVWITGLLELHRLRPGAPIKFATRRIASAHGPRQPTSLDGAPIEHLDAVRLDAFSSQPAPDLEVQRVGEVVHYTLADRGFGPRSAVDLFFAEVNLAEMPRYVPADSDRRGYVFAEIGTPVRRLHFDVFVHEDVYPGSEPDLLLYDTALDGIADVNDPTRDIDRLHMEESIRPLGRGIEGARATDLPDYPALLHDACDRLGWDGRAFRGYRCRIEFPLLGTQVVMAFQPERA